MRTNVHYVTNDLHRLFQDICSLAGSYAQLKKKNKKQKKVFLHSFIEEKKLQNLKTGGKDTKHTFCIGTHC